MQIGQGVAEIWLFSIFQDGGRPPSWICYTPVWTTHEVYFGGLCHCAKFGLNRFSSFDNMQVWIFLALSLKMPIHAHFWGVLGVKIGEIGIFCSFIPPGNQQPEIDILWIKPRKNRFSGLVSGREQKSWSQKKLKTTREWYFTHLPGRPHWGDRFEFWLAGSYRRRNHPCQILWQSVQGFRSSDTPNFALHYRNSWSPLQQCKHYRATLWYNQECHQHIIRYE